MQDDFEIVHGFRGHKSLPSGCINITLARTVKRVPAGRQSLTRVASVLAAGREIWEFDGSVGAAVVRPCIRKTSGTTSAVTPGSEQVSIWPKTRSPLVISGRMESMGGIFSPIIMLGRRSSWTPGLPRAEAMAFGLPYEVE